MTLTLENVKTWTRDDLARLPDGPTYVRYEIIEGELLMTAAPTSRHQRVSRELFSRLHHFVQHQRLGEAFYAPIDVVLSTTTVVQPDIVFVGGNSRATINDDDVQGVPDLMVEIISPSSERRDRNTKFALYARFGVPSYWIVDPDAQAVEEYVLENGAYRLVRAWQKGDVWTPLAFAGLQLTVADIF